jgi:hypothetical protein
VSTYLVVSPLSANHAENVSALRKMEARWVPARKHWVVAYENAFRIADVAVVKGTFDTLDDPATMPHEELLNLIDRFADFRGEG